ncbi:hypothetical protein [Bacillus sp. Marseille-Q3570]|uniref:hypothetical protein n=1 Tax=Bacillus sp. Marseille-Q3570 TaxID=2963522 RepID=UPI0021B74E4A|nr:hypothetical protein [Bacillus sp. Marseille-Q3570]
MKSDKQKLITLGVIIAIILVFWSTQMDLPEDGQPAFGPPFLAEDENQLSLFVVGDSDFEMEMLREEGLYYSSASMQKVDSLEDAQLDHPGLEIESAPAYLVFNTRELEYKTYDVDDLMKYLKKSKEKQ